MDALRWCERIVLSDGVYRSALERIVSYFITDIEIRGTSDDNKIKYTEFLHDQLNILSELRAAALDVLTYGNEFVSLVLPFRRYLQCPASACGYDIPMDRMAGDPRQFGYSWSGFEFMGTCPECGYKGAWKHVDRRRVDNEGVRLKRWNVHEMEILWDPYSHDTSYIWKIPQYYKSHITQGHVHQLSRAPWDVVEAVKANGHLLFDKGVVYHAKDMTLSGVLNKGWGVSRVLSNFKQAWYLQVIRRYNEAIGLDYIIPFRLITPSARPAAAGAEFGDPLLNMDMASFASRISQMVDSHRMDPAAYHVLPFPVEYQMLGAEATRMAPYQMLDQATDTLLNAVGAPVEFYKGTLSIQAAPVALKLFESQFNQLVYTLNHLLSWLAKQLTVALNWDDVKIELARPSHVYDLNRQLAHLQLAMANQISQTTGLKSIGLDFKEEEERKLDEQKFVAEESQKSQEELQASGLGDQLAAGPAGAQPGAPGAAGAPAGSPPAAGGDPAAQAPAGQPGMPVDPVQAVTAQVTADMSQATPEQLWEAATTIADQIFALNASDRIRAIRDMKKQNPTLHAIVKTLLASKETDAKRQGVQFAQQAAQQSQSQSMAPPPA
jgi:hypothetical protein